MPADDGTTILTGAVIDQAALHGLLRKVRDLRVPLPGVRGVEHNEYSAPHETEKHGSEEE